MEYSLMINARDHGGKVNTFALENGSTQTGSARVATLSR